MPVDRCGVGPVRFDGDDVETVRLDQPSRYCGPGPVEFGRAVTCLAEQHYAAIRKAVEHRPECRIVKGWEDLRRIGDHLRQALPARLSRHVGRCGPAAVLGPALFADKRNEGDGAQVLGFKGRRAGLHQLAERLMPVILADRNDKPSADSQLRL